MVLCAALTAMDGLFHHHSLVGSCVCKGIITDPPSLEDKLYAFLLFKMNL